MKSQKLSHPKYLNSSSIKGPENTFDKPIPEKCHVSQNFMSFINNLGIPLTLSD
jgi:hypothetical protein